MLSLCVLNSDLHLKTNNECLWLRRKKLANKSLTKGKHKVNANTELQVSKLVPYCVHKTNKRDILTFRHTCRAFSMKGKMSHH
jgi:hypothetical protein